MRLQTCSGRDGGRRGVVGVDVRDDPLGTLSVQPGDQADRGLLGVAAALRRGTEHPGDLRRVSGHSGLDVADQLVIVR